MSMQDTYFNIGSIEQWRLLMQKAADTCDRAEYLFCRKLMLETCHYASRHLTQNGITIEKLWGCDERYCSEGDY